MMYPVFAARRLAVLVPWWLPLAALACESAQTDEPLGTGGAVDVSSTAKIDGALRDLKQRLDRQAVVWVDGFHLPQDVRLEAGTAGGVRLVR